MPELNGAEVMANFTQKAIKETFLTLLDEKPLSQISVKMLVEACGINRNTFYYHYADIPALIEEIVTGEAERIIAQYPTIDTLRDGLSAVLEFASANRRSLLHIYNSVNRDIFERYLWKVCDHIVEAYGVKALKGINIGPLDREIMKRFYKCECFGLAIEWMDGGLPENFNLQLDRFCELQAGVIEEMAKRAEKCV